MRKPFAGLTGNTWLLAAASFFADVSTEMLYPILPEFLRKNLGATPRIVGVIDGIATATQNIVQGFSGWLADKYQRRKPVALAGFALAAIAKPLIGFATSWPGVLGGRLLDRLGSGTRSAPRDALVAASVEPQHRGKAFGLEGSGDNLGAFLGPLIGLLLLTALAVELPTIFLLAFIPGALAFLMVCFVREERIHVAAKAKLDFHLKRFPRRYWTYLGVTALFGVGNSSNMFLIMHAQDLGATIGQTIIIYALYNLVAALASYPAGALSDRVGRKALLLGAFLTFAIVYACFGYSTDKLALGVAFVFYGVFQGVFRAVGKSFAADFVPADLRASGIGWYSATVGLSGLAASLVAGTLWEEVNPSAAFLYGAAIAVIASVALVVFVRKPN